MRTCCPGGGHSLGGDVMEEMWKDVIGYEGVYQVSDLGRVRRILKDRRSPEFHYLHENYNSKCGYGKLALKGNIKLLHRIVALAFIPNPENKPQVNHKDGDKHNNCASNLEWVTAKENAIHAYRTGLLDQAIGERCMKVDQFEKTGKFVKRWNSFHEISRETGWSASLICRQCKKPNSTAYGWVWRYADE